MLPPQSSGIKETDIWGLLISKFMSLGLSSGVGVGRGVGLTVGVGVGASVGAGVGVDAGVELGAITIPLHSILYHCRTEGDLTMPDTVKTVLTITQLQKITARPMTTEVIIPLARINVPGLAPPKKKNTPPITSIKTAIIGAKYLKI